MSFNFHTEKDSLKVQMLDYHQRVFTLSLDSLVDSNATYVSIYKIIGTSRVKNNGKVSRKKELLYLKYQNDTLLARELMLLDKDNLIKNQYVVNKDETFEKLKNHKMDDFIAVAYILSFDHKYLVVRRCHLLSTTNQFHTGYSYIHETYMYYEIIE